MGSGICSVVVYVQDGYFFAVNAFCSRMRRDVVVSVWASAGRACGNWRSRFPARKRQSCERAPVDRHPLGPVSRSVRTGVCCRGDGGWYLEALAVFWLLHRGKFVLRVADDHFPEQFPQGGEKCFPLTFAFQIHPLTNKDQQVSCCRACGSASVGRSSFLRGGKDGSQVGLAFRAQPFVVALHPDPTVPLKHGQDLLVSGL